jgi:hypothetical protein
MSVADILSQLAANAGRTQRIKGAIYGNLVNDAANVPGQIINDHERQQLIDEERARRNAQDARNVAQDQRQQAADAREQAAQAEAAKRQNVLRAGIAAGFGDETDPKKFDLGRAAKTVTDAGYPDLVPTISDVHAKLLPKLTSAAPGTAMRDESGQIVPGSAVPEKKPDYTIDGQRFSGDGTPIGPAVPLRTPATPGPVHDTPNGLVRVGPDGVAKPVVDANGQPVKGYHPPVDNGNGPLGGLSGDELLAKMSPEQKAQSQALVDGQRTLDPRMANTPFGKTIIAGAYALDPTFDQGNYNARAKARADLVSPNGTGGKTIGALNTAIQHAGKLSDLIEKLDNSDYSIVNSVVNPLKSAVGYTAVTNFNTVAPQLAKEIERVWRGAGGTAGEIHDLIETIGSNKGKQQQREALQQFVELAKGKLDSLERQRDSALGPTVGKTIPILYEQNQPIIDTIAQRASGKAAPTSGGISVTDPQGGVHMFPTQAAADAFKKAAGIK